MTTPNLPKHIAIIMDGNGRWAKKRFLPRIAGHRSGLEAARTIVKNCLKKNIPVLSLFAFSSENWRRPMEEVSYLMDLLLTGLEREARQLHEQNIQLRFIGDRSRFHESLRNKIVEVENLTANNQRMTLLIAADYGGQWDMVEAAKKMAVKVEAGMIASQDITPALMASHLSFSDLPDPDLFIRTSGEHRLSNFMLWQLAYTELYFTDILWPDFDEAELDKALAYFAGRERRFGKSYDPISEASCS